MYKNDIMNMDGVSLHDCRARTGTCSEGFLTFDFADGFYINGFETAEAAVRFQPTDSVTVYIFKEKRRDKAIRKKKSIKWLLSRINKGKMELEFLYGYKGQGEMIYDCVLWTKKKNYECELIIPVEDIEYFWNDREESEI